MSKLERLYDRSDAAKWSRPDTEDVYASLTGRPPFMAESIYNLELPLEERAATVNGMNAKTKGFLDTGVACPETITMEKRMVKGCDEDPDVEVELIIYRPAGTEGKRLPAIYGVAGGAMFMVMIEGLNYWKFAERYQCVVVCPRYASVFEDKYPTQMNQLHAGYQYIVENAKELGINKNRIVLNGFSSGSNLVLSLTHRLKRHGYHPRGCVVECAFADNRPIFPSSTIRTGGGWDATLQWRSSQMYLGANNVPCFNDPEMYPNYATAEDCVGLCPTIMHGDAEDAHASTLREYSDKLSQAGVFNELHVWGGTCHGILNFLTYEGGAFQDRYLAVLDGNFADLFEFDLRRLWIEDVMKD